MRFTEVRLANGLQLHCAETGNSDGPVVLFLHGWPDSWFTFSRVLPLLPDSVRSIAIDQRGFGESERPKGSYAINDFAEDAIAFLDAMSIRQATIVGHSLGTFIARRMAITNPERVDRLVLIASGFSPVSPVLLEAQEAVKDLEDPLPIEFVRDFQSGTAYTPVPESFMDEVVSESLKAPARVWRDVVAGLLAYDDARHLAQISAPTLLLSGDQDALFVPEEQERLANAIPGATLRVYPETGHCPNWERPEQVAADIAAFVGAT